jgi:hypothetical protein
VKYVTRLFQERATRESPRAGDRSSSAQGRSPRASRCARATQHARASREWGWRRRRGRPSRPWCDVGLNRLDDLPRRNLDTDERVDRFTDAPHYAATAMSDPDGVTLRSEHRLDVSAGRASGTRLNVTARLRHVGHQKVDCNFNWHVQLCRPHNCGRECECWRIEGHVCETYCLVAPNCSRAPLHVGRPTRLVRPRFASAAIG